LSAAGSQRFGAGQTVASQLGSSAAQMGAAESDLARRAGDISQTRFGANQALTSQEMGGAQAQLGARQNLTSTLGSVAQQRLAADRSEAEGIGRTWSAADGCI
jgi:hypothetical protein